MAGGISSLIDSLYDSKRKEFLGRDGARWGKLGIFYFFFYLGLAGFFCAMLAVFMAFSPRDRPAYTAGDSQMATRSHPLSPGLGFRPQPDVEKNLIYVNPQAEKNGSSAYVRNLDLYLKYYYPKIDEKSDDNDDEGDGYSIKQKVEPFEIKTPHDCTSGKGYGFASGKPCVLVKMNKIVDFVPKPKDSEECGAKANAIGIRCQGEYVADNDNIGKIKYISENNENDNCGLLNVNRFPYKGKVDRKDVYQAPYIWVQFENPKPNVLISVMCSAIAENIEIDRKFGRGLTRFQIYVEGPSKKRRPSRESGDM